jgi:hypothetical protein
VLDQFSYLQIDDDSKKKDRHPFKKTSPARIPISPAC